MKFSTDPNLLSEKEIERLWSTHSGSTDGTVLFLEQVFDCDRLTAQTVARCITGGSRLINKIEYDLETLSDDVRITVNNAITELRKRIG